MTLRDDTESLVRKAQEGDRGAFDRIVGLYGPRLRTLLEFRFKRTLRQDVDVDDLLQETFLRAFQRLSSFEWRGDDSFLHWVGAIGDKVALQAADRRLRRKILTLEGDFPAGDVSPNTALRRNERFDRLQRAIQKLSPDHRHVILLARIEKVPIKEIARKMGRSPGAVSHLLLRAIHKLKETFGDTESLHLPQRTLDDGGSIHGD